MMIRIQIALYEQIIEQGESFTAYTQHTAIWLRSGYARSGEQILQTGDGCYLGTNSISPVEDRCQVLCFEIRKNPHKMRPKKNVRLLLESVFEWPDHEAVLRLDQVTFPKGTIAYRHVHAGAGIRYLTKGQLEICSDHHSEQMKPGEAWFEDANSPVKAIASISETSQFVRALILPLGYEGKPTIKFLNPEDHQKPKLQENHRFFDQLISF
jgi:quercetin dioxygenase-like cupin family protein